LPGSAANTAETGAPARVNATAKVVHILLIIGFPPSRSGNAR
jgi:hypothetical protein